MFQSVVDVFAKSKLVSIFVWTGFIYLAYNSISSGARNTNFLNQFTFIAVLIPIFVYGFSLMFKPWFKLSKVFATELDPPGVYFEKQSCLLENTRIGSYLNIGIVEQKLYLSQTEPWSFILKPLLINIDAITKVETCTDSLLGECYISFLGEPTITTLVLSKELIDKLENEYGETIFTNKLTEAS